MSVRTMSLVFEYDMPELKTDDGKTVPDSTAKFVLLALADHCNDEGEGAYPGVKRICKKTSMSSQTVCNALNALRHNGYTTLQDQASKAGTNNYTINLDKFQPLEFQPLESYDSSQQNQGVLATRVKPSINRENNREKKGDILDGIIAFGKQAQDMEIDKVEEVVTKLEEGLRLNFPRGTKDQSVYRRILNTGKPIERFIEWVKSEERRLSFAFLYAKDTSALWRDFPQAFAVENQTERTGAFYG